jgi:hypothetical protein
MRVAQVTRPNGPFEIQAIGHAHDAEELNA